MSYLLEVVENIRNDLLLEASFADVYKEIVDNVESAAPSNEPESKVTGSWIAGLVKGLSANDSKVNMLLAAKRGDKLDPESKDHRDAVRSIAALDTLKKYGFVTNKNGQYFKNDDRKEILSKFLSNVVQYVHDNKKDIAKVVRSADYAASSEWLESLSPQQKMGFDLMSQLDLKDIAILNRILNQKDRKKAYTDLVTTGEIQGSGSINKLKGLNIIKSDDTLDSASVAAIDSIRNDPRAMSEIKFINRSARDTINRSAADKALSTNELARNVLKSAIGQKAQKVIDSLDPSTASAIKNVYGGAKANKDLVATLKNLNLLDNVNVLTNLGKAVGALLKTGYTKQDFEKIHDTSKAVRDLPDSDPLMRDRMNQRVADRRSTVSSFIKK
jgi:hypothetical protein